MNPIDGNYQETIAWANKWREDEYKLGHYLKEPAPCLLTTLYAQMVVEGSIKMGKWVKLACKRFLN
ncbi:hypothetical protein QP516_11670, partial [Micrococcus luteus]|nr:hypothetical protein [Micrococcus luteus]